MKTTIRTILCAAAIVLAAASCQKSIEPSNPAEEGKGTIDICVNGLMGEYTQQDGVKSSLVNNVRVAWAAGDVVYVFDGSKYLGKLTAALDKKADGLTDEDRYAKLGGTISAPATTPCVLSLVHSSLMTEPAAGAAVSELSIDMSAQSTATVPFVAYATLEYTGTTITDVVVPFQFATSVIKVNCTGLKANTAITSATLSNVNTECKLTLFGDKAPVVAGGTNGTITRTGDEYFAAAKINDEGEAVFQIAVPKLETASGARVLTVAQGSDEVKDKKFTTKSLAAATSVNTVCQLVGLPAGALNGEFTVSDPDGTPKSGDEKKVHFSQGNLYWDGDSFELETNQYDVQSSWSTSHVCHFFWSKSAEVAYAETYSESGTAATDVFFTNATETTAKEGFKVNVGGKDQTGWRTLSTNEWQYLFNTRTMEKDGARFENLTSSGITVEGVTFKGVVLFPDDFTDQADWKTKYKTWKALNDAGIVLLPAAGYRFGSKVEGVGVNGRRWSSTANGSNNAYVVYFSGSNLWPDSSYNRNGGFSVRLITECQ